MVILPLPTLTDGLRAAPGAVMQAGPLGWPDQVIACLAAKTQKALCFKFLSSDACTVGRDPWVSTDSSAYTYRKNGNIKLMYQVQQQPSHRSKQTNPPSDIILGCRGTNIETHQTASICRVNPNTLSAVMSISVLIGFSDFVHLHGKMLDQEVVSYWDHCAKNISKHSCERSTTSTK